MPPMPTRPPAADESLEAWLRTPRPEAEPGIWRKGHEPRPPEDPNRVGDRHLVGGALLALLVGLFVWSLVRNGYIPVFGWILAVLPDSWAPHKTGNVNISVVVSLLAEFVIPGGIILYLTARLGRWPEVWRRYCRPRARKAGAALFRESEPEAAPAKRPGGVNGQPEDPVAWPEVRRAGEHAAADRLAEEVTSGRMNDVDYARIQRAWQAVRSRSASPHTFTEDVLRHGAAAWAHPSGVRDLPARAARHDLLLGQVRMGAATGSDRNPYTHRGAGVALDPGLLGTSLLAVGPSGAGKTSRILRPVVEAMSLQALAGRAAVVAVGAAGAGLGPDEAYDVVIRPGSPGAEHGLDLYSGSEDPDEAAALLAEALVGDDPDADTRRAATALAQLIGPYRAAHGRFPGVPELRELLDGVPVAVAALREACRAADPGGAGAALRELDARERQAGRPGDPGALLADRVAFLDRPAFSGFFDTSPGSRPFSMDRLDRPVRVRVDLPERAHAEASRLLARLLLAQFTASVLARGDRSLFACLALDDAAHTLTPASVREIQRLRTAHAGVVLGLRTLDDVPERLRAAALGAVGCKVALSGVSTWDGQIFAQAWGRDWVQTEDVTHNPDFHGGLLTRWVRAVRTAFTGQRATTKSVTVRTVERERWSASDLANELPPGHAVLSLMTVRGERTSPILAKLGE
ncbi:ATP-binding protein [Streptomyces sp. HNM0574]|uniref:ATP-binding protein n=1 Tax=Streptomyces sp. HNM0574 TaxID=2714954 RepID=UPI001F0DEFE0|nr:ATP-binding protein [Streptomyces sp. HNM0574]